MPQFIHLHNHTHYSLLDGATTVESLLNAALEHNMPAVALTGHGVMSGAIGILQESQEEGHQANYRVGVLSSQKEAGSTEGRWHNRTHYGARENRREGAFITISSCWQKTKKVQENLLKLTTLAHTEGFYYKPRK